MKIEWHDYPTENVFVLHLGERQIVQLEWVEGDEWTVRYSAILVQSQKHYFKSEQEAKRVVMLRLIDLLTNASRHVARKLMTYPEGRT